MQYLNRKTSIIRSPEYVGAEPTDRATWWNLSLYCAEQENSGIIENCAEWKDRRWQQTCGVTQEEVMRDCALWHWSNGCLIVWDYPIEEQEIVQTKRVAGRTGGQKTSPEKAEASRENGRNGGRKPKHPTQAEPKQKPKQNLSKTQAETQRKEKKDKERKDKGKEEEEAAASAATDSDKTSDKTSDIPLTLIDTIVATYPRRTHYADAIRAARDCIARRMQATDLPAEDAAAEILAGIRAINTQVAQWTLTEQQTYLKRPPEFFAGDHWRDDPSYWRSRQAKAEPPTTPHPSLGGRKPAAIITC